MSSQLRINQKLLIVAILTATAILFASSAVAILMSQRNISYNGKIKAVNVMVYKDSACTQVLTLWDWGFVEPDDTLQMIMYIKNGGNVAMTLNMTASNWNPPAAATYMTITWNREGAVVTAGNVVQAQLNLTVSASITGITDFSFLVTITGTG